MQNGGIYGLIFMKRVKTCMAVDDRRADADVVKSLVKVEYQFCQLNLFESDTPE